jgi:hypothetical protein
MGAIRGYMKATMIATLKTNDNTDLRARGMVIFYGRAATAGWKCAGEVAFRSITNRHAGAVFVARVGPMCGQTRGLSRRESSGLGCDFYI